MRKKQFDQNTLSEAQSVAAEKEKNSVMAQLPKTASGFEKALKALKKSKADQYSFIKKIPNATFEGYFKSNEIEVELLSMILSAISSEGANDTAWKGDFMMSLSKADNFDMTLMFAGDGEKADIDKIIGEVRASNGSLADKIDKAFPRD